MLLGVLADVASASPRLPALDILAQATSMGAGNYAGRMGGPWRCMLLVATLGVAWRGTSAHLLVAHTAERVLICRTALMNYLLA